MYATIHGKPETPPVVPPPTRPPIVTADIISSLTNEHQGRCSDSDDEDGDWRDSTDYVGLAGMKSTEFNTTLYSQQLLVEPVNQSGIPNSLNPTALIVMNVAVCIVPL
ncbi:uncharacterized protein EDB93DRAFT_1100395 [Suillus bovinus]|uniref:uncharacterized protein n=1 Tax=Suillus bovinus TaxID=48563 RepID=UPI001B8797F2|nr:uncharacterized protein EDB93DRAFT_1100395 [Suillus bovinus]KAG2158773.1 hypothetical protein EDB93DRAFT_1100395 [Suillus bovinus]